MKRFRTDQYVLRYMPSERVNHWVGAILFFYLAFSGLALFDPYFWFLMPVVGGGPWARILHPFVGLALFVSFLLMVVKYWRDNLIRPYDIQWQRRLPDVINNRDERLPEIGKYNIGQKYLFWSQVVSLIVLLLSGLVMWRPYLAAAFPIPLIRIAAVLHMIAAWVMVVGIVVHIYAGVFWIKGSLRAMTRGTVSVGWARHHHALWYRRMTGARPTVDERRVDI